MDTMLPAQATYAELRKVNVSEFVEKKNNLSYLSWAWAVDQLLQRDPAASWEYRWHDNKPYISIGETAMVFCTVRAFGVERTAQLPVMDYKNRPIPNPNSFEVNTAMQRALAKAISLHGLGLYIYAGEDLPPGEEQPEPQKAPNGLSAAAVKADAFDALEADEKTWINDLAEAVTAMVSRGELKDAADEIDHSIPQVGEKRLPKATEYKVALWGKLDSKTRTALTKYRNSLKEAA